MQNPMPRIMSAALIGFCVTSLHASHAAPARAQEQLDLDRVFRCVAADGTGQQTCRQARDLIMLHCTVCHSFVRIVRKQADAAAWTTVIERMRVRMPEFGDEDVAVIKAYLVANFRPDLSPPELPQNLLETQ